MKKWEEIWDMEVYRRKILAGREINLPQNVIWKDLFNNPPVTLSKDYVKVEIPYMPDKTFMFSRRSTPLWQIARLVLTGLIDTFRPRLPESVLMEIGEGPLMFDPVPPPVSRDAVYAQMHFEQMAERQARIQKQQRKLLSFATAE